MVEIFNRTLFCNIPYTAVIRIIEVTCSMKFVKVIELVYKKKGTKMLFYNDNGRNTF